MYIFSHDYIFDDVIAHHTLIVYHKKIEPLFTVQQNSTLMEWAEGSRALHRNYNYNSNFIYSSDEYLGTLFSEFGFSSDEEYW